MKKHFHVPTATRILSVLFVLFYSSFLPAVEAQNLSFAKGFPNSPRGGSMEVHGIALDAAGNRYVTGYFTNTADFDPGPGTQNLTSTSFTNYPGVFLAKYDAAGNYVWAKSIGSTYYVQALALAVDATGNCYITGQLSGAADFDPGPGTQILDAGNGIDIYIAKYDGSGNYVWAKNRGSGYYEVVTALAIDASGNCTITGYFSGTVDFDAGTATHTLTSTTNDVFLAKYDASGNYKWAKDVVSGTGNDEGYALAVDAAGNCYLTGYFSSTADFDPGAGTQVLTSNGSIDIFLAKYDDSGNYVWAGSMGGTTDEIGYGVAVDAAGNSYITGYFSGTVDFDPGAGMQALISNGDRDIFLARYDAAGNYVWANSMGGTGREAGRALRVDALGNSYVTGSFGDTVDFDPGTGTQQLNSTNGTDDIFVARYDGTGNYTWAKGMGATRSDVGYAIAIDASGNNFTAGNFSGVVDFDPGAGTASLNAGISATSGYILQLNSGGDYVSAKCLGGYSYGTFNEQSTGIKADASGNSYVTGFFSGTVDFDPGTDTKYITSYGSNDIFLAKYDGSGNYVWAISIGSANDEAGYAIAIDALGNSYITGYFSGTIDFDPGAGTHTLTSNGSNNDVFLAKYDAAGNYVWAINIGGASADVSYGVAVDALGNSYITGQFLGTVDFDAGTGTHALASANGGYDIFLAKYDAFGNYVWAKSWGGTGTDAGYAVAIDAANNCYVTGYYSGTADFDPGAGKQELTSAGGTNDIFLAKYDASGNYVWAKGMNGSIGNDVPYGLALDGSGNCYITGQFLGVVDLDPGAGTHAFTSAGISADMFLARYDASGNYVWANQLGGKNNDAAYALAVDAAGNSYITGVFTGTVDFDPGAGTQTLISIGTPNNIFLAKYNASGNYVWAKNMAGGGNDFGTSVALDASNNCFITGYFGGTVNFDPGTGTQSLVTGNGSDIFIAKYEPVILSPITLESFTGQLVDNDAAVLLQWTTATQPNLAHFEVERSPDTNIPTTIGQVTGCDTCTGTQPYSYTDHQPLTGKSYYRIRIVDKDGKVTYSTWVPINKEEVNRTLAFYPTVTTGKVTVSYKLDGTAQKIYLNIFDAQGKLVQQKQAMFVTGKNQLPVNLSAQLAGLYYIQLKDQDGKTLGTGTVIRQ